MKVVLLDGLGMNKFCRENQAIYGAIEIGPQSRERVREGCARANCARSGRARDSRLAGKTAYC